MEEYQLDHLNQLRKQLYNLIEITGVKKINTTLRIAIILSQVLIVNNKESVRHVYV